MISIIKTSNSKDSKARYWYALYTRPRFEKKVDAELRRKGLESYLPVQTVVRIWSDRRKKLTLPLFPSYVFIHTTDLERYVALQTLGAIRLVSFNGAPTPIPDYQIRAVQGLLELEHECVPQLIPYLSTGTQVEIISGPFKGLIGFILEHRTKNRFVFSIDGICQSIALEMEAHCLKPL